jgi:hypothetical protein
MCYSATASFGSAALLASVGAVTVRYSAPKSYRLFAAIPLLFGVQQAAEGIVWLTIGEQSASALHQMAVLSFLGVAVVIWPSWLPWSVLKIEKDPRRRMILKVLCAMGAFVSALAAISLYTGTTQAFVEGHSLGYTVSNASVYVSPVFHVFVYFAPAVLPLFVSTIDIVRKAGYLILASLLLAAFVKQATLTSVWCFFAAIISLVIATIVISKNLDLRRGARP